MEKKAILITDGNKDGLITWYNDDLFDGLIADSLGWYLVAGFGELSYIIQDEVALSANFTRTGKTLEHGYFEVIPK